MSANQAYWRSRKRGPMRPGRGICARSSTSTPSNHIWWLTTIDTSMICLEVSEVSDDRVQDALTRLAADQEGSLPGLLGFLWTHASRGEISGRLEVEKQHLAPTGFLHAATVVALADTACGHGCLQSVPELGRRVSRLRSSTRISLVRRTGAASPATPASRMAAAPLSYGMPRSRKSAS